MSGNAGLQSRAPSSANARTDPHASRAASRNGLDESKGPASVKDTRSGTGTAANGAGAQTSVTGANPVDRTDIEPSVAVIDAALGDLDRTSAQNEVMPGTELPPDVDRTESQTAPVLAIAAASLTLSVTWKPAIFASRARSRARRRPL